MTEVVAVNCKWTNEVLVMKNVVMQKSDDFSKNTTKNVECIKLNSTVVELQKQIDKLVNEVETLKAEKYCADLIALDTSDQSGTNSPNLNPAICWYLSIAVFGQF